jgi:putative membrane protein
LSRTEAADWRRTSPLAAVFYLGKIYQALAKNAVQSLAPLAAFLVAFRGDKVTGIVIGVGLFVLGTAVMAFLRYWFFRFSITGDSLLIRDGVFRKRQLDIAFERVQGINTTQNIVFRLFDLVTVKLDTAGSSGEEGHLPAIGRPLASEIRERIRRTPAAAAPDDAARPVEDARTLVRLTFGDIVRVGLSSGRVFLVLVVVGPLLNYLEQEGSQWVEENEVLQALGAANVSFGVALAFAFGIALLLIAVLMLASIVGALLRYHRYELVVDGEVLRSTGGLLTRHEQSVHPVKIQSVYVIQNLILRRLRRYRLRMRQATSGRATGASRFDVPVCTRESLAVIGREIFEREFAGLPLEPDSASFQPIARYYLRSRTLLFGVVPAVLAGAVLLPKIGLAALLSALWIPVAGLVAWLKYRRYGIAVTNDGAAFRRGLIGWRVVAWLHRKVQRITVTQSPFQRRRGLATMKVFLAAGSVSIPFVEYAAAARLRDFVLYRVESSRRAWH